MNAENRLPNPDRGKLFEQDIEVLRFKLWEIELFGDFLKKGNYRMYRQGIIFFAELLADRLEGANVLLPHEFVLLARDAVDDLSRNKDGLTDGPIERNFLREVYSPEVFIVLDEAIPQLAKDAAPFDRPSFAKAVKEHHNQARI